MDAGQKNSMLRGLCWHVLWHHKRWLLAMWVWFIAMLYGLFCLVKHEPMAAGISNMWYGLALLAVLGIFAVVYTMLNAAFIWAVGMQFKGESVGLLASWKQAWRLKRLLLQWMYDRVRYMRCWGPLMLRRGLVLIMLRGQKPSNLLSFQGPLFATPYGVVFRQFMANLIPVLQWMVIAVLTGVVAFVVMVWGGLLVEAWRLWFFEVFAWWLICNLGLVLPCFLMHATIKLMAIELYFKEALDDQAYKVLIDRLRQALVR